MVSDKGKWLVEIGYKNHNTVTHFIGTQRQLDRYIMKQYKNKAEYVVVELVADNIDNFNDL